MKTPAVLEPPPAAMKKPAPPEAPPPPPELEREPETVIDTSKMSRGQREALELTEAARTVTNYRSFAGDVFMGHFSLAHVYPFPLQPAADVEAGRPFLDELHRVL